jgi:hypothetical protein
MHGGHGGHRGYYALAVLQPVLTASLALLVSPLYGGNPLGYHRLDVLRPPPHPNPQSVTPIRRERLKDFALELRAFLREVFSEGYAPELRAFLIETSISCFMTSVL